MGSTHHTDHRRAALLLTGLALAAAASTACSASDDDRSAAVDGASEQATDAGGAPPPAAEDAGGSAGMDAGTGFGLDAIGRDLAIELHVSMTSDDLRATVEGIRRTATANGGGVVSSDVDFGEPSVDDDPPSGRATLVVKVPPAGLDAVLGGLDRLGEVTSISQAAEDVTDRLIDLDVRIRNQRESVARIRELLGEAADLDQVVRLESELTAREVELERLEATQQELEERVALSTVTIDVVPASSSGIAGDDGIGDAFGGGWDAFVTVVFGFAFVLAVLAPFLAVAVLGAAVVWAVWRRGGSADRRSTTPAVGRQDQIVDGAVGERERGAHAGVGHDRGEG